MKTDTQGSNEFILFGEFIRSIFFLIFFRVEELSLLREVGSGLNQQQFLVGDTRKVQNAKWWLHFLKKDFFSTREKSPILRSLSASIGWLKLNHHLNKP